MKWMKGTGWVATGSLHVEQAKKAGELISEVRFPDSVCVCVTGLVAFGTRHFCMELK